MLVQNQIQNVLAAELLSITTFKMVPQSTFQEFALEEYSKQLRQAITDGSLSENQVNELATEEVAEQWIGTQRENLEGRFKVVRTPSQVFFLF